VGCTRSMHCKQQMLANCTVPGLLSRICAKCVDLVPSRLARLTALGISLPGLHAAGNWAQLLVSTPVLDAACSLRTWPHMRVRCPGRLVPLRALQRADVPLRCDRALWANDCVQRNLNASIYKIVQSIEMEVAPHRADLAKQIPVWNRTCCSMAR
jgi:hypothetical protein